MKMQNICIIFISMTAKYCINCSKSGLLMPMAVYHSGGHQKRNCLHWNSVLESLTLQSSVLLIIHWDT